MWPKLLMQYLPQLVELLPHVSRVVPMADKYLAQRGAKDEKLDALAEGVRGDLGKVAKAHIALAEQLDAFSVHVSEGAAEAKLARMAAELAQLKVETLEKRVAGLRSLVVVSLVAVIVMLAMMVFFMVSHSH
jgi:hypothetical protein